jgi:ABC-type multidrug transport system fused ATPase/permease subunit
MLKSLFQLSSIISRKSKIYLLFIIVLAAISAALEILNLSFLFYVINYFTNPLFLKNKYNFLEYLNYFFTNFDLNTILIILFLVIFIFKTLFNIFLSFVEARYLANNQSYLSNFFFNGYMSMPNIFHQRSNTSTLIKNLTIDLQNILSAINCLFAIIIETIVLVGIFFFLLVINFKISIISFLSLFLFSYFLSILNSKKSVLLGKESSSLISLKHKLIKDGLSGAREFQLSNSKEYLLNEFRSIVKRSNDIFANITFRQNLYRPLFELFLVSIASIFIYISLGVNYLNFDYIIPLIVVFFAASYRLIPSFSKISINFQKFKFYVQSAEKLYRDKNKFFNDSGSQVKNINFILSKEILVNDLSFTYSKNLKFKEDYIFTDINFIIPKNAKIGIYGPSGSGKSTLLDILMGITSPSKGQILIDGINILQIKNSYQKIVSCIPQDIFILDTSLKRNIAFGLPEEIIDNTRVEEVIKIANLCEFESKLRFGSNTLLGDNGSRLSGGQKQRIGIARALYSDPQILIFDEATNALDSNNENQILEEIFLNLKDKTIIFVSHNLKNLLYCETVYELKNQSINKIK